MKRNQMQGAPKIAACLGIGTLAGMLMTVAVCAVGALLIGTQKLSSGAMGYCAWISVLLGAVTAALTAGAGMREKWWMMCLASGGLYYLCLLCCTALCFGGQYDGAGVGACMAMGGSGACALLALTAKGRPGRGKRRVKIRRFV